jgi:hypothetical protein
LSETGSQSLFEKFAGQSHMNNPKRQPPPLRKSGPGPARPANDVAKGHPINFVSEGHGRYRARIDNIELVVWSTGYHLIVWEDVIDSPCEYDGCHEGLEMEACIKLHGSCPKEVIEHRNMSDDLLNGLSGFAEVESAIRAVLGKRHHPQEMQYPHAAASRFATAVWKLSD